MRKLSLQMHGSGQIEPEGLAAQVIDDMEIFARAGGFGRVASGQGPVSPIRSHIRDGHGVAGGLGHPVLSKRNLGWGSSASRCQKTMLAALESQRGACLFSWTGGAAQYGKRALFGQDPSGSESRWES